jgi:hypothetical protein
VSLSPAAAALASLTRLGRQYGPGLASRKLDLLAMLARTRLATAPQVKRLHELLCFLHAYPDNRQVQVRVRRMLQAFRGRPDLRRHRATLAGSGIAGTDTPYRFFWPTARWLSARWPGALRLDRGDAEQAQALLDALPQLLEPVQADLLRRLSRPTLDVLDRFRPRGLGDADYFISLVSAMPGDDFTREAFFDRVDAPFILRAGPSTPERTTARLDFVRLQPQRGPLRGPRPELRRELRRRPRRIVELGAARTRALIELAHGAMATRERDLAVFQFANRRDAFLVDDGAGLAFAMVGMLPERRLLLPATYGGITLQNGIPIGYVQVDVLGRHAELSFNQFETFRDGPAAHVFVRFVAMVRHVFRCDRFSIEPYQLGEGNDEGIESGAWWFYRRFGFWPRDPEVMRVAAREERRIALNPGYRSPRRVLTALARRHLFYAIGARAPISLPRTAAWLAAGARALQSFPRADAADRRAAAMGAARAWLAAGGKLAIDEHALSQWAGLVLALARQRDWTRRDRRELAHLIGAKYGRSERLYLRQLLRHARLRRMLDC